MAAVIGGALLALFIGGLALLHAAHGPSPSPSAPSSTRESGSARESYREPGFSGCAAVLGNGTCELAPGATLRAWIPGSVSQVGVSVDGADLPASKLPLGAGSQVAVAPPAGARAVAFHVDDRLALRVRIAWARAAPEALTEGRRLRNDGKLAEANARAEELIGSPDPVARARGLGLRARIALSRGDDSDVDVSFERALEGDRRADLASDLVDDAAAWIFSLQQRSRFAEARRVLDSVRPAATVYPEGEARLLFYEGDLAASLGHPRRAATLLGEASLRAEQLSARWLAHAARQDAARVSTELGRARDGLDDLVQLYDREGDAMSGCERADVVRNIAWLSLQVADAPHGQPADWIDRALALFRTGCPAHDAPRWTMGLLGSRAVAAFEQGDLGRARALLREARAVVPHPPASTEVEWLDLEGRLAEAKKDRVEALRAFDLMFQRAQSLDSRDLERLALERRATVFSRAGARDEALAALDAATALTDAQSIEIPIGEGRESYLHASEGADARRIELLVALGRPADALAHLRRAHARVVSALVRSDRLDALQGPASAKWEEAVGAYRRERDALDHDAGEDWKFSASTLADRTRARAVRAADARRALEAALAAVVGEPHATDVSAPPPEGEVLLALYAGATQWIGFVAEGSRVRAQVVDRDPARLLAPFAPEIRRARRLAVVTFGDARKLDVHALPFDGGPLIAAVPVVYPLDAPHVPRPRPEAATALVVGDPTSDLPSARAEATQVSGALAPARAVTSLTGDDARGDAVRSALAEASLFHYAGHGVFAGRDGWESALPLAEHAQLAISDVLALPRVPATVVLGGCETARASGEADAEGLGVAQAFVVAGAESVVAATRVVDDAAAAAMARALYAHLGAGGGVPEALQAAQRELDAAGVKDWAAFRVLVP